MRRGVLLAAPAVSSAVARISTLRALHTTALRRNSPFRTLGVPPQASLDDVRRAFRRLAKTHHPDVGGDGAQFNSIKDAYDTIVARMFRSNSDGGARGANKPLDVELEELVGVGDLPAAWRLWNHIASSHSPSKNELRAFLLLCDADSAVGLRGALERISALCDEGRLRGALRTEAFNQLFWHLER